MKLLLDTHTFLWWTGDSERLSERVKSLLADPSNELILSVASVWEMQIKLQLGKLNLELPLQELIANQQQTNNLQLIPIHVTHLWALENLPIPHKDPFDRILIAQATVEQHPILSIDVIFDAYPVNRIW